MLNTKVINLIIFPRSLTFHSQCGHWNHEETSITLFAFRLDLLFFSNAVLYIKHYYLHISFSIIQSCQYLHCKLKQNCVEFPLEHHIKLGYLNATDVFNKIANANIYMVLWVNYSSVVTVDIWLCYDDEWYCYHIWKLMNIKVRKYSYH